MGKIVSGDRTVAPLVKAVFVICVLMVFGLILNYVVKRNETEYRQKTAMRISLIREEYERKMGDLKLRYQEICEQKMQEITSSLKNYFLNEMSRHHTTGINKTDPLQTINSELKKMLSNNKNDKETKRKSWQTAIDEIDKKLQNLKARILSQNFQEENTSVQKGDVADNADFIILTKLTKKLEELMNEMKN